MHEDEASAKIEGVDKTREIRGLISKIPKYGKSKRGCEEKWDFGRAVHP